MRIHEYLEIEKDPRNRTGRIRCIKCGAILCEALENYKEHVPYRDRDPKEINHMLIKSSLMIYREYYCPGCATLLEVDPRVHGEGHIWDIQLGDTFTFNEGEGIDIDISTQDTILISAEIASSTNPGVASFSTDNFDVTGGGAVTIKALGVNYAELAADANHVAVSDGSTSTDIPLGSGTIQITGNTEDGTQFGVATTNTAGNVNIAVTGGLNALDDATLASEASGDLLVRDGTDFKNVHISHVHTQSTSATSWTVTHSIGQKFVNVTVYDSTDNVIIPQSIVATSTTVTTITFNTAITGTAVVMGVPGSPTSSA